MDSSFRHPGGGFDPGTRQTEPDDASLDDLDDEASVAVAHRVRPHHDSRTFSRGSVASAVLAEIAIACERAAGSGEPEMFDLSWLDPGDRIHVTETLGLGTTTVRIKGDPAVAAQATSLPGLWYLQGTDIDRLEIAPIPTLVFESAFTPTYAALGTAPPHQPGAVHGRAVLAELIHRSDNFTPAASAYTAELNQLGLGPADVSMLEAGLGVGSVTMLTRGNGTCMVKSTAVDHIWRVQVLDPHNALIFDAFEVTRFPSVGQPAAGRSEFLANSRRLFQELEPQ